MGTINSIAIGGLIHSFYFVVYARYAYHFNKYSKSPGNFLIRHINPPFYGSYLALPFEAYFFTVALFFGNGIFITTFWADIVLSKIDLTFRTISISYPGIYWITGITLKGKFIFSDTLYVIS